MDWGLLFPDCVLQRKQKKEQVTGTSTRGTSVIENSGNEGKPGEHYSEVIRSQSERMRERKQPGSAGPGVSDQKGSGTGRKLGRGPW